MAPRMIRQARRTSHMEKTRMIMIGPTLSTRAVGGQRPRHIAEILVITACNSTSRLALTSATVNDCAVIALAVATSKRQAPPGYRKVETCSPRNMRKIRTAPSDANQSPPRVAAIADLFRHTIIREWRKKMVNPIDFISSKSTWSTASIDTSHVVSFSFI